MCLYLTLPKKTRHMEEFISVEKLIKLAKKRGVDFGKGDPYNRLRYYTKMGWIPHMTRKSDRKGNIKGHYPMWILDRLVNIEDLKKQEIGNDEITKKLEGKSKVQNALNALESKETKNRVLYALVIILILITISNEVGLLKIGKYKYQNTSFNSEIPNQIISSGTAFVPRDKTNIFIKSKDVSKTSIIYVAFKQNYTPASRYWVENIQDNEGFTVRLDAPVAENSEFSWWITN